ncbi:hypothetical protein Taro_006349 [Colocasia esculenta]|uniref:Cyclin n=1 Tax=Colocasia esculenta TaxID=4460 RepID=A0A843U0H0_COLES|nr:hypothetical protein [Colocasia esculenta]
MPSSPISPSSLRSDLYATPDDEPCPPLVIPVLASLLDRAVARNERPGKSPEADGTPPPAAPPPPPSRIHAFDSRRVPDMSIRSFLERVFRYTGAAPSVYVVAYVYVDRVCRIRPGLRVTQANAHRLLLSAIVVASKFLEDINYRNSRFAEVGGLPTGELNRLELELLFLMGFKLHVSLSVFESYCRHLEREVSLGGGYQIERALRLVCGGEITGKKKGRAEQPNQSAAHVL